MAARVSRDYLNGRTQIPQFEWDQAQTLEERLTILRSTGTDTVQQWSYDRELAERRYQKWQQQAPFDQEGYFAARLNLDNVTEEELLLLLGESPQALHARVLDTPAWLNALLEVFSDTPDSFSLNADASYIQPTVGFLPALSPFLKRSYARLSTRIQALTKGATQLPFDPETIGMLFLPHLARRISLLSIKTFTLELNIARLEGHLEGETPAERFHAFLHSLSDSATMLDILKMYPVLARRLITIADYWETGSFEILTHLCQDWPEICAAFSPEQHPGLLTAVEMGIGDTHCQGHSVAKLTFASGFQLIYKPKSLAIDQQFAHLLDRLNAWGDHLALRVARVIDRDTYGWAEFIETHECSTPEEMEHFYQRLGSLLAVLYILEATDMHFENMIAAGEHPILIDLESLFHPYIPLDEKHALSPGDHTLRTSVMRTALLPHQIWKQGETDGIDISGLGGLGGQLTPFPVVLFEGTGTDQMRLVRERVEMGEQQNRPRLAGNTVDTTAYIAQLVEGFSSMYRLLLAHRQELLDELLPLFAHTKIRVIARATRQYGRFLEEGTHPTLLRNALDQGRFLDRLWVSIPHMPALAGLIRAEQHDLHIGDIPMFWTYTDSRELYTSQDECIPDFFEESSLTNARNKVQQLSEQDLFRQTWIIQASVLLAHLEVEQTGWKGSQLSANVPRVEMFEILSAACKIGDRLCEEAICTTEAVSWLTVHLIGERSWSALATSLDLYNGLAGICLFLAYLGDITQRDRYTIMARKVLDTIRRQITQLEKHQSTIGLFDGWAGLLYLYAHLAAVWQEPAISREAQEMLVHFVDSIEKDTTFDVIGGAAGCILGLLALYQVAPTQDVLQAALRCGEHLLSKSSPMARGQGWLSPIAEGAGTALAGFSHGTAGIALSLFRLAAVSGEKRFHEAALSAITYERSLYSSETRNWPDLREISHKDHEPGSMQTWCHGAPGIGMARLASLPYSDDSAMREEIALAIEITLEKGFGANHSLCHGDLGNLELLLSAAQLPGEERYRPEVERLVAQELESIQRQGWCTGIPHSIEIPGLMTGIAGIGYGLLRVAAPDRVPAVLLLAPPLKALSTEKD